MLGTKGIRKIKLRSRSEKASVIPRPTVCISTLRCSLYKVTSHYKEKILRLNIEIDFHMEKRVHK